MTDSVLVLGSGGREHALSWKLAQSPDVQHVYVAPGNAGTPTGHKVSNIDLDVNNQESVVKWCIENDIKTVVVGPEAPLADGISNLLNGKGVPCFGPSAEAAEIESSKHFSKEFMKRWVIPTARYEAFTEVSLARTFINSASFPALVVKASGLAAGKGVIVAKDRSEACQAVQDILQCQKFGSAGDTVIVEELLEGEEISCLAFTDGETVHMMPPAQDYKRLGENDTGPNTGGMGAYCPCPLVSAAELEVIRTEILQKAVDGMRAEGRPYQGLLYAGLMLTSHGPKVLEFNCRFGDPETQVLLPLMESDLYRIICACINKQLHTITPSFHENKCAVAIVTVANGYPNKYNKGMEITGLGEVENSTGRKLFHAGTKVQDDKILTNGGRVLAVVAMDTSFGIASKRALDGVELVQYNGKIYRRDIAKKALESRLTYSDSGVSIAAGDALVDNIKTIIQSTVRPGCVSDLGMFGGAFDLKKAGYDDPLLVSGTDGVGTKLKIAQDCNEHSTIGIDLVAMCVNDVLCHRAEPLYFLDYFACGKLDVGVASDVIKGVATGCEQAGCALIGGETAEMPGMYKPGEYDLAGFTVGAVERSEYLPNVQSINIGDHVIGLASSGIHSNGFSLVRKVVETCGYSYSDKCPFDAEKSLGQALLAPTKIYVKPILTLLRTHRVKAIAHITGGGLPGNLCRVLPVGMGVQLDSTRWQVPDVFRWLAQKGNIEGSEMARTFNCGIGLVLIVDRQDDTTTLCDRLSSLGCTAQSIGSTVTHEPGQERVVITGLGSSLRAPVVDAVLSRPVVNGECTDSCDRVARPKKRVGILISGSGTNMKALIDYTNDSVNEASSEIALVISNKPGVKGLALAHQAGIPTLVISHKDHKTREDFDAALHTALTEHRIDVVCLAGFMRILTGGFVRKWNGRMLNVHPSLLPSFKGGNAHEQVLASNVRISGCTVHFVAEEVDAGAILVQEPVPVYPDDTMDTLTERVKTVEHKAFPQALELVTSGRAVLGHNGDIVWTL